VRIVDVIQAQALGGSRVVKTRLFPARCSIRNRRDEWITAGVFERLEQICLDAYDRIVGLELGDLTVDGCLVKAPCGGEAAGKSPVDRGKQGTKRSVLADGHGIPLGCVVAPANRHDSPLLRPTLEKLGRSGFDLPPRSPCTSTPATTASTPATCWPNWAVRGVISKKGCRCRPEPGWVVERANSWHNRPGRRS
jgi:hypothetical protein